MSSNNLGLTSASLGDMQLGNKDWWKGLLSEIWDNIVFKFYESCREQAQLALAVCVLERNIEEVPCRSRARRVRTSSWMVLSLYE